MLRSLICLTVLLSLWLPAHAKEQAKSTAPIASDFNGYENLQMGMIEIENLDHLPLRTPVEFLMADPHATIDNLPIYRFRPLTSYDLSQGISEQAFWLRFRVQNSAREAREWVLSHEHPYTDSIQVFVRNQNEALQLIDMSDREPFSARPLNHRTLAMEHTTPAQSYTDIHIRVAFATPETVTLSFYLSSPEYFQEQAERDYLLQGMYLGVMALLLLVAIIFGFTLRDRVYWCYAFFILTSGIMWAKLSGIAYQYFWPNWVWMHNEGFNIVFLLTAITALQFSRVFLGTKVLLTMWDKIIVVMQAAMLVLIAMRLAGNYLVPLIGSYIAVCTLIILPVVGFAAYRKGKTFARWYALAWVIYSVGLVLSVLSASTNIFSWGMAPLAYAQIGSVAESVLLLVALAERLMNWEKDRVEMAQQALSDEITGLGNRRKLEAAYEEARNRFSGDASPEFLVLLALDNFDEVLDSHGHDTADAVLKDLGASLREYSNARDVSVRYAGEEFVMLLEAASMRAAYELVEQIREEFASSPTSYRGVFIQHTLTAGITELTEGGQFISQREAIARAERALHQARTDGGNCTVIYRTANRRGC